MADVMLVVLHGESSPSETRTRVLRRKDLSYGMEKPPDDSGISSRLRSRKRASTLCSCQSWVTDSSVYLKDGTQRTLVKVNRTRVPPPQHVR